VYRYHAGKADWLAAGLPSEGKLAGELRIGSIAHRDTPICRLDQRIGDLNISVDSGGSGDLCVVVNDAGVVLGDLRGKALHADPHTRVADAMNPAPTTYRPDISVHEMAHVFLDSGAHRVLVTDCDGRLIGWLSKSDVDTALETQRQQAQGPILASTH
jgi:Mg/Co/Ni transporter MgtE